VPSIENTNLLDEQIVIDYDSQQVKIDLYDTSLTKRFLSALKDNLEQKRILEKNFCFLGWADSKRDLKHLVNELNKNITKINAFEFDPSYEKLKTFDADDFQYSDQLPTGLCPDGDEMSKPGLRLKHDACNLLHRYFEELQGTAWAVSKLYKQADHETKYAIRQLNNICHEIESWVLSYRKSVVEPNWIRPSQITTFLNAPRHNLQNEDFELFKQNRYDRELGGVYLHWSQVGKTLFEVFRDEHAPIMTEAMCSEINHQKFYSGEFDIEWGQSITENDAFKKQEINDFRSWLKENNYDWEDPKLSLGYIKLGQVNLQSSFGTNKFVDVYNIMKNNLNIKKISTSVSLSNCEYPYSLDSDDWQEIQMKGLKSGYESRGMR
tara:strand:+ start:1068 stop:2204 length:1137 start_codon:yes stop_codon:yes gene_type:complete